MRPRNRLARKRDAEDERARRTPQQASTAQADEEGWVEAESVADLSGPLLLLSSDNKNSIITAEPLRIVVCAEGGQMSCPVTTELDLPAAAALLEPTDVSQVLLGQSLVPGKYSLKSAFGKYVTCDLLGHVAASKDAVGPAEEWKFTRTEHGFVFENVHGALLALEPTLNRVFCVPKDSTAAPSSTFHVRCQAGRKHSADQSTASGEPVCNLQTIETEEAYHVSASPH